MQASVASSIDNLMFASYVFNHEAAWGDTTRLLFQTPAHICACVSDVGVCLKPPDKTVTTLWDWDRTQTHFWQCGYLVTHNSFVTAVAVDEDSQIFEEVPALSEFSDYPASYVFKIATVRLKDPQPAVAVGLIACSPWAEGIPWSFLSHVQRQMERHKIRFLAGVFPKGRMDLLQLCAELGAAGPGPFCNPFHFGAGHGVWT